MCLENSEWGRLLSQITGNCVFCHIKFDARPVCDWSRPLPIAATVAQASDAVYMKASPPPFQGAINRGREASGSQCNEIKPNQPQLPVFYWALFQFPSCVSICIRKILSVAASACYTASVWGTLCEFKVRDLCVYVCVASSFCTLQGMAHLLKMCSWWCQCHHNILPSRSSKRRHEFITNSMRCFLTFPAVSELWMWGSTANGSARECVFYKSRPESRTGAAVEAECLSVSMCLRGCYCETDSVWGHAEWETSILFGHTADSHSPYSQTDVSKRSARCCCLLYHTAQASLPNHSFFPHHFAISKGSVAS